MMNGLRCIFLYIYINIPPGLGSTGQLEDIQVLYNSSFAWIGTLLTSSMPKQVSHNCHMAAYLAFLKLSSPLFWL